MTAELERAARGARAATEALAATGKPVIGIVGRDVPAVLVAAAGAHAFRIAPEAGSAQSPDAAVDTDATREADAVMGRAIDLAASRVLAAVLSGALDFLSGILVSRDTEASVRLFYTLQELHRRGRITVPVQLVDQVHQNRESTLRFNTSQLAAMWHTVEVWSASSITTESLGAAAAAAAGMRSELERVRELRRAAAVSGTTSLHAYRVATALPAADAVRLLRGVGAASGDDQTTTAFPVFLTGSAPLGDEVYRAIESAGAIVVGEDHDWGDPILSDRLPSRVDTGRDEVLRQLAVARLRGAPASASSTMAARAAATRDGIAASGARALLSVVRHHDEAPAWDWRHQRELAAVPAVMVRGDAADDLAQIVAAVDTLRAAS